MWLGLQELGGENEKESDRERIHKVTSKTPSHLPLLSWLGASSPLLSTCMQPHLLWVLLIGCPPSCLQPYSKARGPQ